MRVAQDYETELNEIASEVCCVDAYKENGCHRFEDPEDVLKQIVSDHQWMKTKTGPIFVMENTFSPDAYFGDCGKFLYLGDFYAMMRALAIRSMMADVQISDDWHWGKLRAIKEINQEPKQ